MRGRGPRRRARLVGQIGPPTAAREDVERRWFSRQVRQPELEPLVTGEGLAAEPRHRWLPFKQAFSPELVRRFLQESFPRGTRDATRELLDPFAGCGTLPVECGLRGFPARGIEALPSLTFIGAQKATCDVTAIPLPALPDAADWAAVAPLLHEPLHRAALICAVARQHNSEGRLLKQPAPLLDLLRQVAVMVEEDVRTPPLCLPRIKQGDAGDLSSIEAKSIGGILTSPPYLSRYDYTRALRPLEDVYRAWYPAPDLADLRHRQVRAHPKAYQQRWHASVHPAVEEACGILREAEEPKWAGVVRSYFDDLTRVLRNVHLVLADGAPAWIVVAGARLQDVYVPTDTILADLAVEIGLDVESVRVARRLTPTGRKLGRLSDVAPRESILVLRRP